MSNVTEHIRRVRENGVLREARRLARNLYYDLRFGGFIGGSKPTPYRDRGAYDTQNSDYVVLPEIFRGKIGPADVLVEVGCGKGRVLNWWLAQGFANPMIGIELDPAVASETKRRLRRFRNVQIVNANVLEFLPRNGTLFYLYNPFNAEVMRGFRDRIFQLARDEGRDIQILYYNCIHRDVFDEDDRLIVESVDLSGVGPGHALAVVRLRPKAG